MQKHPIRTCHRSDSYSEWKKQVDISVVIPVFNEEANIRKLHEELTRVLTLLQLSWEIIFTDDGSKDNSWQIINELYEKDNRVKGLRLSRNFGHQYALFAGLSHSCGRAVITMDGDLQHPPEIVTQLVERWQEGNKIVHTIRTDPEDFSIFKKFTAKVFYRLFSFCSGVGIKPGMADFRLIDRDVVDQILQFRDAGLFLRGIVQWVGYPSAVVHFKSSSRSGGVSNYTLAKMIRFGWDGISSFSIIPLRLATLLGFLTSGISFSGIIYAFYSKYISGSAIPGWASSMAIISFLLGVLFILVGLIGEYIGRILIEVMNRPRYLVWEKVGLDRRTHPTAHSDFCSGDSKK